MARNSKVHPKNGQNCRRSSRVCAALHDGSFVMIIEGRVLAALIQMYMVRFVNILNNICGHTRLMYTTISVDDKFRR